MRRSDSEDKAVRKAQTDTRYYIINPALPNKASEKINFCLVIKAILTSGPPDHQWTWTYKIC
jgi:hypothetical protein